MKAHLPLRECDVIAQSMPMDLCMQNFRLGYFRVKVILAVVILALVYQLWQFYGFWIRDENTLSYRWLRVGIAVNVPVLCFFIKVLGMLRKAITDVKQPYYTINEATKASTTDLSSLERINKRKFIMADDASKEVATMIQLHRNPNSVTTMVVYAKYSERLGNNVFQYVTARLRAWMLHVPFVAPALGAPFHKLPTVLQTQQLAPAPSPFALLQGNISMSEEVKALLGNAYFVENCMRWLSHPISGYVMNTKLYAGFQRTIRAWIRPFLDAELDAYISQGGTALLRGWQRRDVAIHVRLGDILWGHHTAYTPLPMSFYRHGLYAIAKTFDPDVTESTWGRALGRVVLVTEDATHRIILGMKEHLESLQLNVITQSDSVTGDFGTLYTAPNLILSISSFAWWAGAVGNAVNVVFPHYGLLKTQTWHPEQCVSAMHDLRPWEEVSTEETAKAFGLSRNCSEDVNFLLDVLSNQTIAMASLPVPDEMQAQQQQVLQTVGVKIPNAAEAHLSALRSRELQVSSRVVVVDLPYLRKWDGKQQHAIDGLFD